MQQQRVGAGREGRVGLGPERSAARPIAAPGQAPGREEAAGPSRAQLSRARVSSRRAPERRAEGRPRALVGGSALCAASGGKTLGRAGCRRQRRTETELN